MQNEKYKNNNIIDFLLIENFELNNININIIILNIKKSRVKSMGIQDNISLFLNLPAKRYKVKMTSNENIHLMIFIIFILSIFLIIHFHTSLLIIF